MDPRDPEWNVAVGALLITLSVGIGFRSRARWAAVCLGVTLCLYALLLYVPRIVARLHDPGPWTNILGVGSPLAAASEILAMSGAAWVLAGGRMEGRSRFSVRRGSDGESGSRALFAGPLIVFGLQHFLYSGFLATLIPSWIPWRSFWEVGCRHGIHRGGGQHRNQQSSARRGTLARNDVWCVRAGGARAQSRRGRAESGRVDERIRGSGDDRWSVRPGRGVEAPTPPVAPYFFIFLVMFARVSSSMSSRLMAMLGAKLRMKSISSSVGGGVRERSSATFNSHGTSFFTASTVTFG